MLKIEGSNININKNSNSYEIEYKNKGISNVKLYATKNGNLQFILKLICFEYLEIETKYKTIIKNDNHDKLIFNSEITTNDYINIKFELSLNKKLIITSIKFCDSIERINIAYDHIFVINLKNDIERRNCIQTEFKKFNITKYEFLDAIDGKTLKNYKKIKNTINSKGHYGCLMSHKKAIEISKSREYKNVIILEDDIMLSNNFYDILINQKVPLHDMLYFSGLTNEIKIFVSNFSFVKNYYVMGAYSYLLNEKLYDIVLNLINTTQKCIDILYVEDIQQKYNVLLLNDIIYTDVRTTNTSSKKKIFYTNLDKLKIKYRIDDKIISFDDMGYEYFNIIGNNENKMLDYIIKERINIYDLKQLEKLKSNQNYNLLITNLFGTIDITISQLINYEYFILITDYYWINDMVLKEKNDKSIPWIYNYNKNYIKINGEIIELFKKAKNIIFLSEHSLNIYKNFFDDVNFILLNIPKLSPVIYEKHDTIKVIGIIKTEYFYNEDSINKLIIQYYEKHDTIKKIYIVDEFYMHNLKLFIIENKINHFFYSPLYPVCYNPNIEIINSLNIKIN